MTEVSRRTLIKATGAIGAAILPAAPAIGTANAAAPAGAIPAATSSICATAAASTTYVFFNSEEAAFIEAAVARLIPADEEWPGSLEACVPNYIDKQLGCQGYQLPYTPAELFRTALGAINKELSRTPFAKLSPDEQDNYLKRLEAGGKDLGGVPSDVFFAHLWDSTVEGFFGDPVYGGNCNMVSWRMIGFPGAYASYYDLVDQHGIKLDRAPMSLAEDAHGHVRLNPGIPARSP